MQKPDKLMYWRSGVYLKKTGYAINKHALLHFKHYLDQFDAENPFSFKYSLMNANYPNTLFMVSSVFFGKGGYKELEYYGQSVLDYVSAGVDEQFITAFKKHESKIKAKNIIMIKIALAEETEKKAIMIVNKYFSDTAHLYD